MNNKLLATVKLPLTLAVSSCLLVACGTTQKNTPTNTATPISTTATSSTTTYTQTSTPSPMTTTASSGLDAETLSILDDLLTARDMSMVENNAVELRQYGNLWDRLRRGYRLTQPNYNQRIENQKAWFSSRQDYLNRLTARASRYLYHTVTEAERRGIPTELALLPIIESSYDPSATSNASAAGLWQFIPSTGRLYGLNQTSVYDGRRDVIESTRAAYDFLTTLYNQFGSWELALAAYNAGPGRIQRAIDANAAQGMATDYWSLRLPTETMNYVPRFMAVAQIVQNPAIYGVSLPPITNHAHFRAVSVNYGVSLNDVSSATGIPTYELQLLNPALTNLKVENAGPNRVLVPNSLNAGIDNVLAGLKGYGTNSSEFMQYSDYVAPKTQVTVNRTSAAELESTKTLPTTAAGVTSNRTIVQEPPLSQAERDFIASQIAQSTNGTVQPISAKDGNIELNAVQTAQSVLDTRGQIKTLSYGLVGNNSNTSSNTNFNNNNFGNNNFNNNLGNNGFGGNFNNDSNNANSANNGYANYNNYADYNNVAQPSHSTQQPKAKTSSKSTTYVVARGDTLAGIARKTGVSVSDLRAYNGLSSSDSLKYGTRLSLVPTGKTQPTTQQPKAQAVRKESHIVKSGETLTSIASHYNLSLSELAEYNDITTTTKVQRGQKLWLVAGKVQKTAKPAEKPKTIKGQTYKVQAGDTLTSVANKYDISVGELAAANGLSNNDGLVRGKTITIPVAGTTKPTKENTRETTKEPAGKTLTKTESYRVKAGDSLTSLSSRYSVSVADLAKTNNLSSNAKLINGSTIKVPKVTDTYTVKSGDSLNSLAKKYGVSVGELAQMNGLKAKDKLQKGQKLTVPNK